MNYIVWMPVFFYFSAFYTQRSEAFGEQAKTPPRGWNSYDSFSWTINEEEFLQSAQIVSEKLLTHGYDTVVVDYLWYRRNLNGDAHADSLGLNMIDEWGRMIPDPDRWPSSRGGIGFSEVSKKVHAMGLKFGIHIMRGISTQAVNANTPILDVTTGTAYTESGRQWYAKDIGLTDRTCPWMSHGFMSVNTNLGAAKAFLRSLQQQYADWGVDFGNLCWGNPSTFASAHLIGDPGLNGYSWPDLDMLPIGWLTDPGKQDFLSPIFVHIDEVRTQMTLWSMAKSPIMFGGDVRKLDDTTYNIIANPTLLEINSFSENNVQIKPRSWVATGRAVQQRNLTTATCTHSEVWTATDYGVIPRGTLLREVAPHGCALFVIKCM
ncbi:hypothetical protein ACHQM5_010983 [Ranunculus cassubicifolius]